MTVADLRLSPNKQVNVQQGVAVVQTSDAVAQEPPSHPNIINAIPAMIDDDEFTRYFIPDEFTVQFREASQQRVAALLNQMSCEVVRTQRTPGYFTVTVPRDRGLFETMREFARFDEVEFVEPSEIGFNDELYTPTASSFSLLWGLENTGQRIQGVVGKRGSDISALGAWRTCTGDPSAIVVVIDTGCEMSHPNLSANLLPRNGEDWDFENLTQKIPRDLDGHGTHVAGTAAAADVGQPVIGVAPTVRFMPLRIDLTAGMNANRADAINFASNHSSAHPDRRYVINCSWRASGNLAAIRRAIANANANNIIVVFAAGNANNNIDKTPQYPAVYPGVVAVAAVNNQDQRASFSNYGRRIDVSAPGVDIFSTVPGGYKYDSGTSMAAPHVSALAALLWSRNPKLTSTRVKGIIKSTADNIDVLNPSFVGQLGSGRVNAFAAMATATRSTR